MRRAWGLIPGQGTRSHMLQLRCSTVKVYSLREIVWHHKYNSIINGRFPPTFLTQCFIFCTTIFPDILTATGHSSLSVFPGNLHLRMLENHRSEFSSPLLPHSFPRSDHPHWGASETLEQVFLTSTLDILDRMIIYGKEMCSCMAGFYLQGCYCTGHYSNCFLLISSLIITTIF